MEVRRVYRLTVTFPGRNVPYGRISRIRLGTQALTELEKEEVQVLKQVHILYWKVELRLQVHPIV
jgi:hypothetical protein